MSELGRPPEFGSDGEDPPVRSPSVLVAEDFCFVAVPGPGAEKKYAAQVLRDGSRSGLSSEFIGVKDWLERTISPMIRPSDAKTLALRHSDAKALAALGGVAGVVLAGPIGAAIFAGAGAGIGALIARRDLEGGVRHSGAYEKFIEKYNAFLGQYTSRVVEIRRIQVLKCWVRDDPIIQLSPGSITSKSVDLTLGISEQETRQLGGHIGVGKLTRASLNAQVSARISRVLTVTRQEKVTNSLTLDNSRSADRYRRFAIWHPEETVDVSALRLLAGNLMWTTLTTVSFTPAEAVALTSSEVR